MLTLSGQDDDAAGNCRILIAVNGHAVFEGTNAFAQGRWERQSYRVDAQFLRDNQNTLTIRNLENSEILSGPPFFLLNYAVLNPKYKEDAMRARFRFAWLLALAVAASGVVCNVLCR